MYTIQKIKYEIDFNRNRSKRWMRHMFDTVVYAIQTQLQSRIQTSIHNFKLKLYQQINDGI